jgi:cell volume regulation protein A
MLIEGRITAPSRIMVCIFKMSLQEKLFVGWVGLRGAVPIVLATFPLLAGLAKASFLFDLVFFVVLASVLLQGTTVPFVAQRLGVIVPASAAR